MGGLCKQWRPVFVRPQQKSGPTEVDLNNGVDPLASEVCAETFREKGTAKGENATVKLKGRCICEVEAGRQHQGVQASDQ